MKMISGLFGIITILILTVLSIEILAQANPFDRTDVVILAITSFIFSIVFNVAGTTIEKKNG